MVRCARWSFWGTFWWQCMLLRLMNHGVRALVQFWYSIVLWWWSRAINRFRMGAGEVSPMVMVTIWCPLVGIKREMNLNVHEWYHIHNEWVVEYVCIYSWVFTMLLIGYQYVHVVMKGVRLCSWWLCNECVLVVCSLP